MLVAKRGSHPRG